MRPGWAAVAFLSLAPGAAPVGAQPEFPPGSVTWIHVGKIGGLDSAGSAALVGEGVTAGASALLGDEGAAKVLGQLAAEATRQRAEWSICVIDGGAAEQAADSRSRFAACFRARGADALADRLPRPSGPASELRLRSGRMAAAYSRAGLWPRTEWLTEPGEVTVGFGPGTLDNALAEGVPGQAAWDVCRRVLDDDSPALASAWIDLNALRRASPEGFSQSGAGRLLAACGVANGRGLMLRVTSLGGEPPVYAAALSWSARSEPESVAHRVDVTERAWPPDAPYPDGAEWALVVRSGWGDWIEGIAAAWRACGDTGQRDARYTAWLRDHGPALGGLLRGSGPYVSVCGGPRGLELRCGFDRGARGAESKARAVFRAIPGATFDAGRGEWTWRLGSAGVTWRALGPALVATPTEPPGR